MAFNSKSLENLKQNRRKKTDVPAELLPNLPIEPTFHQAQNNQRVAKSIAEANAPGMMQVLVNIAYGRRRGIAHAVRVQAASKVLEAAGMPGQVRQRVVDGIVGMSSEELAAFVQAGTRALRLQEASKQAVDAELVSSCSKE